MKIYVCMQCWDYNPDEIVAVVYTLTKAKKILRKSVGSDSWRIDEWEIGGRRICYYMGQRPTKSQPKAVWSKTVQQED